MINKPVYLLLIAVSLLTGCKSSQKISLTQYKNDNQLLYSVRHPGCFGRCPSYFIFIYTNGLLLLDKERNMDSLGQYCTLLSKKELKDAANKMNQLGILKMADFYPEDQKFTPDGPSTVVSVKDSSKVKTIIDNGVRSPESLTKWEIYIETLAQNKVLHLCDK